MVGVEAGVGYHDDQGRLVWTVLILYQKLFTCRFGIGSRENGEIEWGREEGEKKLSIQAADGINFSVAGETCSLSVAHKEHLLQTS